jgi:hypothetical protein
MKTLLALTFALAALPFAHATGPVSSSNSVACCACCDGTCCSGGTCDGTCCDGSCCGSTCCTK